MTNQRDAFSLLDFNANPPKGLHVFDFRPALPMAKHRQCQGFETAAAAGTHGILKMATTYLNREGRLLTPRYSVGALRLTLDGVRLLCSGLGIRYDAKPSNRT